jgi:RimJ/RimL family protein N-acetyltransferase
MTDREGQPFLIRRYEPADRVALERMYDDFEPKRSAQGLPPDNGALARWLDDVLSRGQHTVVEVGGRVLGHLMLMPTPDGDGSLELANFLHQSIRNRGIGTELNRIAIHLARDAGARSVWLSVEPSNRAAVRSYLRAGFRRRPGSLWAPEIEMEAALELV